MNATHGAVAPHILAPTITPPATGQEQPFTATETFLIEASRSNSLIDTSDGGDFNAKWTNSANFNLRRGDRISVEMCAFNAANAGGGVPTIELTGEKAKAQGETKSYCDNKVLLEIYFYLNNNNTYSVGFPCKFPTGIPQPQPANQNIAFAGPPATTEPIPGINGITNLGGVESNWGNHKIPSSRPTTTGNLTNVCGYAGWGEGFAQPVLNPGPPPFVQYGGSFPTESYTIYQFHISGAAPGAYVNAVAVGDLIDGIVLATAGDPNPAGGLLTTYAAGYVAGLTDNGNRFNGLIGHRTLAISDVAGNPYDFTAFSDTIVSNIQQQVGATNRIELVFQPIGGTQTAGTQGNSTIFFTARDSYGTDPDTIEGLGLNPCYGPIDAGNLMMDNININTADLTFYRRRGGSFQRYNQYNIGAATAANNIINQSFSGTTYCGQGFAGESVDASGNNPSLFLGKEGYRGGNLMKENNNKPYILTRNDFYGQGRMMPSMEGYMPYLKPQTAFILLDADELFTDLTTLANRINDILHQRLPGLGLENSNYSDYILNTNQYADTYQKGSSVIPYALVNNAYYDDGIYNVAGYRYNESAMRQVWDTIPPISSGGTVKVQPANFQAGYNYALTHTNKLKDNISYDLAGSVDADGEIVPMYIKRQTHTFCRSVTTPAAQTFASSNICYGNMFFEDMAKQQVGDCWARMPCHPLNCAAGNTPLGGVAVNGICNLSMPAVVNTRLAYYRCSNANGSYYFRTQALSAGSVIFTNMTWLGTGALAYDWKDKLNNSGGTGDPITLFENLAEAIRRYEVYTRKSNADPNQGEGLPAKDTFAGQERDNEGWSMELDLGWTDDESNMLGWTDGAGIFQHGMYPVPAGFGGPTAAEDTLGNNYTNQYATGKTTQMKAGNPPGQFNFPTVANPNQAAAADNYWGTGIGVSAAPGAITRDFLCPTFSDATFGSQNGTTEFDWSQDFKTLRPLGRIKIRSRPTKDYFAKNSDGTFKNLVPFEQEPRPFYGIPINPAVPDPSVAGPDPQCRIIGPDELNVINNGEAAGSLEYFDSLGLPFIPYEHTDSDGRKRYMIALVVANRYRAQEIEPNTWSLAEMSWGLPIGVSKSFYDNHAIAPMNPDQINFRNRLAEKYTKGNEAVPVNTCMARNNFNYIYVGAPDPTFSWNESKNRFEFLKFQQNTLFSAFTTQANTTAQQGEPCAIINSSTRDARFSIIDPYIYSPVQDDPAVTIANGPKAAAIAPVKGNIEVMPNQGIRDAEGGIGIWNIWLCPPDYTFPQGINPVNYWSQKTNVEYDPNWNVPKYLDQTEANHAAIIKGCVKADRKIWEGNLLYKLGFTPEQIAQPYYGKQSNRYSPDTYNNTNPNVIGTGTKPLLLGNSYNNTQNPATNLNYQFYPAGPPATGTTDLNGLPKFLSGLQNNQPVAVSTQELPLTATDSPILTDSPFFLVYSDICETNYQSGATKQPALFYVMRNYPNQGYFYGGGSNYYQVSNQDRVLSNITTEVRNPATGELAKLSPNSVLMYKIERDIVVPAPTIDAMGNQPDPMGPAAQPDPTTQAIEQLTAELTGNAPRTFGGAGGAGSAPGGGGGTNINDNTGAGNHNNQAANWVIEPDGQVIQAAPPPPVGAPPGAVAPPGPVAPSAALQGLGGGYNRGFLRDIRAMRPPSPESKSNIQQAERDFDIRGPPPRPRNLPPLNPEERDYELQQARDAFLARERFLAQSRSGGAGMSKTADGTPVTYPAPPRGPPETSYEDEFGSWSAAIMAQDAQPQGGGGGGGGGAQPQGGEPQGPPPPPPGRMPQQQPQGGGGQGGMMVPPPPPERQASYTEEGGRRRRVRVDFRQPIRGLTQDQNATIGAVLDYVVRTMIAATNTGLGRGDGGGEQMRVGEQRANIQRITTGLTETLEGLNIFDMIGDMVTQGENVQEIMENMVDAIGDLHLNRDGMPMMGSSGATHRQNRTVLEVTGTGRGRYMVRDIVGDLMSDYRIVTAADVQNDQFLTEGNVMFMPTQETRLGIAERLRQGFRNRSIVGVTPDNVRFPLGRGTRRGDVTVEDPRSQRAREAARQGGGGGRSTTRSEVAARREEGRQAGGKENYERIRAEQQRERDRTAESRGRGETQVSRSGQAQQPVGRTSTSGAAQTQQSQSGTGNSSRSGHDGRD